MPVDDHRESTTGFIGRRVVDPTGALVGSCSAVFADADSGALQWLSVDLSDADRAVVVPLNEALQEGGSVQVSVDRSAAASAPALGSNERLSSADQLLLSQHFHLPGTTRGFSDSVRIPAGATRSPTPAEPDRPATTAPASSAVPLRAFSGPGPAAADAEPRAWTRSLTRLLLVVAAAASSAVALRRRPWRRPSARKRTLARTRGVSRPAAVAVRRATQATGPRARRMGVRSAKRAAQPGRRARSPQAVDVASRWSGAAQQRSAKTGRGALQAARDSAERLEAARRKTMRVLSLGFGAAVGYVLGAKAGRERYEQLVQQARRLAQRPEEHKVTEGVLQTGERRAAPAADTSPGPSAREQTTTLYPAGEPQPSQPRVTPDNPSR
jgi:hypothetical protein